jgi:dolichyl-phosphate-mannose-protein mannosyltransferase
MHGIAEREPTTPEQIVGFLRSPSGWIALSSVALGIVLRTWSLRFPSTFLWDEHHFVENAQNYLSGAADTNDHPPLGKLIMAGFMHVLGDEPLGWRAGAWVAGLLTIACGGVAVARLFRNVAAGLIAAALLAADGFLISYSRAALLDGYLALSVVVALILVTLRVQVVTVLLAGVLAGAATCIKFSGVCLVLLFLLNVVTTPFEARRRAAYAALLLGAAVATYLGAFTLGLSVAEQDATLPAAIRKTVELYVHHSKLTDMKHPMTSGWVTWALPMRPLVMGDVGRLDHSRVLTSLGNLAIWWSSVAFGLTVLATLVWTGLKVVLSPQSIAPNAPLSPRSFIVAHGRSVLLTLGAALGFLAPWVMSHRDSYINHFLPIYVALIVLLSGFLGFMRAERRSYVLAFLVLVLLVTAFYAPVWSLMPMSHSAVYARLFLPWWR